MTQEKLVDDPADKVDGKKKWSESELLAMLEHTFPAPAYCTLTHVRNSTGFAPGVRTADAMIFGLWPSKGLDLTGVEVKVSRSDFLHELDQPTKTEAWSRYTDYWYILAPPGMIKKDELPATWGLMEPQRKRLKTIKAAVQNEDPGPISRVMLAGIMRSFYEADVKDDTVEKRIAEAYRKGIHETERRSKETQQVTERHQKREYDHLKAAVQDFQARTGIDFYRFQWRVPEFAEVFRVFIGGGRQSPIHRLRIAESEMSQALDLIRATQQAFKESE